MNLNIEAKTINFLGENIREYFHEYFMRYIQIGHRKKKPQKNL